MKTYYMANKEKIKTCGKTYYQTHKEEKKVYNQAHKKEKKIKDKEYYFAHKKEVKDRGLRWRYNLTLEQKDKMFLDQNHKCPICNQSFTDVNMLQVDHNHTTEEIRGLLCQGCNILLGAAKDNPIVLKNAINYLKKSEKFKGQLKEWSKTWFSWTLQSLAWMGGIAVAIKELLPKASGNKGLFDRFVVNPDIPLLIWTGICLLIITGCIKYWRDRK